MKHTNCLNNMNKNNRVVLLHNIISPYRLPIFEGLSEKINLIVYFCKETDDNRLWDTSTLKYKFRHTILPNFSIGPFVINYTLLPKILRDNPRLIIVSENPENALTILFLIFYSYIFNKKIILLTERIDSEVLTLTNYRNSSNYLLRCLYFLISYVYTLYRKLLYISSKSIITFSEMAKNNLLSEGVAKSKIYNLPQIMPEVLLLKPASKELAKKFQGKIVIFTLCYLTKRKGIDNLIISYNRLKDDNSVLLIGGSGEFEDSLKYLAKSNKNIHFLGYLNDQQKANYYSISDFFVFPTQYDVWGFVVNEALYYGLPVISTDRAGAIELIDDGRTGCVVKSDNIHDLATEIEYLLKNPQKIKEMKGNVKNMSKTNISNTMQVIKGIASIINKYI